MKIKSISQPRVSLLTMSRMGNLSTDDKETVNEFRSFYPISYDEFFSRYIRLFSCGFDLWSIKLIGDNASVNRRIASILGKSYIGYASHKLNLEVRYMLLNHDYLRNSVESIYSMMCEVKSK